MSSDSGPIAVISPRMTTISGPCAAPPAAVRSGGPASGAPCAAPPAAMWSSGEGPWITGAASSEGCEAASELGEDTARPYL
jgi:hypothetical protein